MSQAENLKPSPSSNTLGWFITHKVVLLILILVFYTYFSQIPEGMIMSAVAIGLLAIASSAVMAAKVIDLGLPLICIIAFTIAKLVYAQVSEDPAGFHILEAAAISGIIGSGITGFLTGKIVTRKYIPPYFGSFAVPCIILFLLYLVFNNTSQSINEFLSLNNMYSLSPSILYILAGAGALLTLLFSLSRYGKNIRATGSSRHAAIEAGINTDSCIIQTYTVSGLLAGIAGIILVTLPENTVAVFSFPILSWLPAVILGAVIGSNKFSGGRFDVIGAALGGIVTVLGANVITDFTGSIIQATTVILLLTLIIVMAGETRKN